MGEREAYAQAMREGHQHAWDARWREAAASYRAALEALPGDATARSSLAAALANAGAPAEALDLLEQLAEQQPNDSGIVLRLAELRQRTGRQDLADQAYLRVAELYRAAGLEQKAIGIWRRLIGLAGHRPATMRQVAAAAHAAGAPELAVEAATLAGPETPAAAAAPADPVAAAPADAGADGVGGLAAALRARRPSAPPPAAALTGPSPDASAPRAALDDALAALQTDPNSPRAARAIGLAACALGATAVGRAQLAGALDVAELDGDVELAVALIDDLRPLTDDPFDLHRRQVRIALAADAVELAADAHLALADLLIEQGAEAAGLAEARRARAVAPTSARVHAAAAPRLARGGAVVEADDARRRAFQLDPRDLGGALAYAVSAARRGALEELAIALDAVAGLVGAAERSGPVAPGPAAAIRAALSGELSGDAPALGWARARLLSTLDDPAARSELRALVGAPPPIGPVAALELAEAALAHDDPRDALSVVRAWLEPATAAHPDVPAARLAGLALSAADRLGDGAAAVSALRLLSALSPEDTTLGGLLAERLAAVGDRVGAAAELARLGAAEEASQDLAAAAALYAAAVGLAPSDAAILQRSADLARRTGNREEARRLLLHLADLDPERRLASLLAAADLSPWAARIDVLRRAIKAAPADPEPRRRLVGALVTGGQAVQAAAEAAALAELLQAAGDRVGALAAIEQARRLDPWNPGLQVLHEALTAGYEGQ